MKEKKEYLYEIKLPVKDTWWFEVYATSKKEALELVYSGDAEQTCSIGGWPNRRGTPVVRKLKRDLS